MQRALRALIAIAGLFAMGCGGGVAVRYRAYDPYRRDYHVWNADEGVYYNRWVIETRRPPRDFRRLRRNEQEEYWRWRHDH